ncbi:ABC transporter ATP-binding protein [Candidatus Saccharibacteria bacterium]|nr:ABC transporter ATP-binding protein [Candidatus Saccharibacteria bacterium]
MDYLLIGSSAMYNLAGLLPPVATAGIIRMITENNYSGIWIYVGMYVGFYVLYFGFLRINNYAYTKIAEFYHITLQERLFKSIEQHPEILKKIPQGRALDTFADDVRWVVDAVNVTTEAVLQFARLVIIFVIFLTQDFVVGIIAVFVDAIYLLILNKNAKDEAKHYANARRVEDKVISAFTEMVNTKEVECGEQTEFRSVVGDGLELEGNYYVDEQWAAMERSFPTWRREYRKRRHAIMRRNTVWAALPYLGKILLYILLAKMVINGTIGLDILVLLIGYFEMAITCMNEITDHLLSLSNYGVRIDRIKQLLKP